MRSINKKRFLFLALLGFGSYLACIVVFVVAIVAYIILFSSPSTPPENYSTTINSNKCAEVPTPSQTEGPYYKTGSPQRNNIAEETSGEKLIVTGFVYDKDCKPIANAWLDFWHADTNGVYDNAGYKLRGHQFTDENGMYRLETIVPAAYETRPPHIHVKVRALNGPILTSQMYFPNDPKNQTDSIFNQELIMSTKEHADGKITEFNFVLNL